MLEQVYTQKRDGTKAAPSYSKIKKVARLRKLLFFFVIFCVVFEQFFLNVTGHEFIA